MKGGIVVNGSKIMVVEDNSVTAQRLKTSLENLGYQVELQPM